MNIKNGIVFNILFLHILALQIGSIICLSSLNIQSIGSDDGRQLNSILQTEIFEVAPGINYEYVYVKAQEENNGKKPTILFIHGFPSSLHCWRHQIEYFSQQGYGCLALNTMGYGRSYSPLNKNEYRAKSMVDHFMALLNHLNLEKVFVIGHDWGTKPASRIALYQPNRTLGLVLLSVGYPTPGQFDLDQAVAGSAAYCGFDLLGYWKFFDSDDAASIIENNLESFIDLIYVNDTTLFKIYFTPTGQMRQWLINQNRTMRAAYMTENDYNILRQYLAEGMQPKLNWYKAAISSVDWDDEKNIDPTIRIPVLSMRGKQTDMCFGAPPAVISTYLPNLETMDLDTGHWLMEEQPDTLNQVIEKWMKKHSVDANSCSLNRLTLYILFISMLLSLVRYTM